MSSNPEANADPFNLMMRYAQVGHSEGDFEGAIKQWNAAIPLAPSENERAQALRGLASSTWRSDPAQFNTALSYAQEAQALHMELREPHSPETVRQQVESDRVVGRIFIHRAVGAEIDGDTTTAESNCQQAMMAFGGSYAGIVALRKLTPQVVDQHEINALPDIAIGKALATRNYAPELSVIHARTLALRAVRISRLSERPQSPNSARLGRKHRAKAVLRNSIRASAALTISELVVPDHSRRRQAALHIAARVL